MDNWQDVSSDARYQKAPPDVQQKIRNDFFDSTIASEIPEGVDAEPIRQEFLKRTEPAPKITNSNAKGRFGLINQSLSEKGLLKPQQQTSPRKVNDGFVAKPIIADEAMPEITAESLSKPATSKLYYAGELKPKPKRSLGDAYGDTANAVFKIAPTAAKGVVDIANYVTQDSVDIGASKTFEQGLQEFDNMFGSDALHYENEEFSRIANNPNQGFTEQASHLLKNPTQLADKAITTVGSAFLPAGVASGALGIATKVLGSRLTPQIAAKLTSGSVAGTVAMQNAADTFNDPDIAKLSLEERNEAAAITMVGTLFGNKLFGGGLEKAIADKFNKTGLAQGFALAGKEAGQEISEDISQSIAKEVVAPESINFNKAAGSALTSGLLGGVVGGGFVAGQSRGQRIIETLKARKAAQEQAFANANGQTLDAAPASNQDDLLSKINQYTGNEAIDAANLLDENNVSNTDTNTTMVARAANELGNNAAGSNANSFSGDESRQLESAVAGSAAELEQGNGSDMAVGAGVSERNAPLDNPTPEPQVTLDAQAEAFNAGNKPSLLITRGETMPKNLPDDVKMAEIPDRGILVYRDEATLQQALNGKIGEALGYGINEKPLDTSQVVTARDANGTVIQDVATNGSQNVIDAAKQVAGNGTVEIRPIESAMAERQAGIGAQDGQVDNKQAKSLQTSTRKLTAINPLFEKNRAAIESLAPRMNWGTIGNKRIDDAQGNQIGRTKYEPIDDAMEAIRKQGTLSYNGMRDAVDKALNGKPLSKAEQRTIDLIADYAENNDVAIAKPITDEMLAKGRVNQAAEDAATGQSEGMSFDELVYSDYTQSIKTAITDLDNNDLIENNERLMSYDEVEAFFSNIEAKNETSEPTDKTSVAKRTETPPVANDTRGAVGSQTENVSQQGRTPSITTQENSQARPIVEAITKRRAAAAQIGKEKAFDTYLALAKKLMKGETVKPTNFKLAAAAFKADPKLAEAFNQLQAIAQAPAKEARADKTNTIEAYKQRIAAAKTIDALQTIAGEIQRDSALSDTQAATLDDAVFDAQDEFDITNDDNAETTNESDINRSQTLSRDSSWVIRNKETGEVVRETFQKLVADKVNTEKYEAVPILKHLQEMNDQASKVRKYAQRDQTLFHPKTEKTPKAAPVKAEVKAVETVLFNSSRFGREEFVNEVKRIYNKLSNAPVMSPKKMSEKSMNARYKLAQENSNLSSKLREIGFTVSGFAPRAPENTFINNVFDKLVVKDSPAPNADLLGDNTAAKQAIADAERAKDTKRNTGNSDAEGFTLTGSDSEADKAAASGAQALFSRSNKSQTNTPAFKKWFGDSKVVDENGNPQVIYHGTDKAFYKINMKKGAQGLFWFTSDKSAIESGEVGAAGNGVIMEMYAKIENPAGWKEYDKFGIGELVARGYDGVILPESDGSFVGFIFEPNQVKSATKNNGDFDSANNDIRFSRAPTFYSALTRAIENIQTKKADPKMWQGLIKNLAQKGVKPDEIEWTGVNEWLDLQTGSVTKEELLAYLDANGVQVEETVLSDIQTDSFNASNYDNLPKEVKKLVDMVDNGELDESDLPAEAEKIGYKIDYDLEGSIEGIYKIGSKYDPTKYSKYTVPGGNNYKELLLTLPAKNQVSEAEKAEFEKLGQRFNNEPDFPAKDLARYNEIREKLGKADSAKLYKSSHFSQPNILAHVRFDERTDADGNKVLFINEIQSDWAQQGKKQGFKKDISKEEAEKLGYSVYKTKSNLGTESYFLDSKNTDRRLTSHGFDTEEQAWEKILQHLKEMDSVPTAPFVQKTDAWVSLALKRMMRYAAENGFDKVAIINGQQAADLYDLSKQVEEIKYSYSGGDTWKVIITTKGVSGDWKQNHEHFGQTEQMLEDLVGKEITKKIIELKDPSKKKTLTGVDLKVGGEGMRTFYDQIVPKVAKDVLKKLGGELSQTKLNAREQINLTKTGAKKAFKADEPVFFVTEDNDELQVEDSDFEDDSEFWDDNKFHTYSDEKPQTQVSFTITPEMREKIMGGLPLFSKNSKTGNLTVADVKKAIANDIYNQDVDVYQSIDDAPMYVQTQAKSEGAFGVEGFFDSRTNRVALIADNLVDAKHAVEIARHELIGHYGIENMLNDQDPTLLNRVLKSVAFAEKNGNKLIVAIGKEVDKSQPGLTIQRRTKEIIAVMAERNVQNRIMKRVIDAIRTFLNKIGFTNSDTTDAEISALLRDAQRYLKAQGRSVVEASDSNFIGTIFSRGNRKPSKESGDTFLTAALEYLAREPEFFQSPRSDLKNIAEIAKEVDAGYTVKPLGVSQTKLKNATKAWDVTVPNATYRSGVIYEKGNEVWIDVSRLISGNDRGSRIYAIAADYAHNNGKVLIGDPEGLSKKAYYRRNENMLSSALKHGTTKHLMPHIAQEKPAEYYQGGESNFGNKVRALSWIEGDDVNNIKELILNSYKGTIDNVSEIKNVTYNAESRQFEYDDGRAFTNRDSERIAAELSISVGAYRAGSSTLKRAALFNTFLRKSSEGRGRELLGALVNQLQRGGLDNNLKGVMYSRTSTNNAAPPTGGVSTSAQLPLNPNFDIPEPSKIDNVLRTLQDKNIDLKRVTENIKKAAGNIYDNVDAYLQEELYHGRAAKRTQDFLNKELNPLITAMNLRNVTMTDFEEYLKARHAEERNIQVAKVNPDMPDGGSGMTTQEAKDYLNGLTDGQKRNFEALAKRVDAITKGSRQVLVDYNLESAGSVLAMEAAYEYYVPLMREDMDMGFGVGTGQGFSVKGNSGKRATGSKRAVVDILANIAQQRERNIIRGEKNRVSTALIGLAKLNPNEEFWQVDTPPKVKLISKVTGLVEEYTDPNYKSRNNVVVARIADKNGNIQERSVVFNERNERAVQMALSLKNLDRDQLGEFFSKSAVITRYFASINTQYNPMFGVVNIMRDVQGALLNLSSTPLKGKQAQVMLETGKTLGALYKEIRAINNGGESTNTDVARLYEDFAKQGGKTGYQDMFRNAAERGKAIEKMIDPAWWQKTKLGKVVSANGTLAAPEQFLMDKAVKPIFDWLSDYNEALENTVRLATYKVGLDSGLSKQQAASTAKNISVNFNRKGNVGSQIGSLYAFFNASVQGTARIGQTLLVNNDGKLSLSKAGTKIITGGLLLGAMQALAFAMAGFDDEEPPEFVRDRNIVIPISGGKYIAIPMPLGFNAIPSFGRIVTEWMLSGGENTGERVVHIMDMLLNVTNPIGNAGLSIQTVAPTLLDPLVALTENKDFAGRPIAREDFSSKNPTPGYTRAKDTASDISTGLAYFINSASGGNEYRQGSVSPTPDQIDYLIGQVFGGVGREGLKVSSTVKAAYTGDDLPNYKIPLIGKFYGNAKNKDAERGIYYNNIVELNKLELELKGRRENGDDVDEFKDDNPLYKAIGKANATEKTIARLNKQVKRLEQSNASEQRIKMTKEIIAKKMKTLNEQVRKIESEQQYKLRQQICRTSQEV